MALPGRTSGNNPSGLMAVSGLPGATTEVTAQQVEDQIDQLNQLSQQLRALPQPPAIEQTLKGQQIPLTSRYVPQSNRVTPGLRQPLGVDPGYLRNIARNPLTGPNGLTKDILSDLMYGNLKSLASAGGISNYNNPLEESALSPQTLGNSEFNEFNNPLLEEKVGQSALQKPSLGLPLPPNENVDFNDLLSTDLSNLKDLSDLRSRHHAKSKRKKKRNKSDVVTKLLLTLLVDKLKDIYEMDKLNSTHTKPFKIDSSTIGKIENTLKERSHPANNRLHSEKDGGKDINLMANFDSNLSFPLTISDKKGSQVSLVDLPKNDDNSSIDVDTKNIESIIKGIENGYGTPKENSSTQIMNSNVAPGSSPQDISQKITKTLNNDNTDLARKESGSEFHRVKIEPEGVLGKSGTIPSISDYHPTINAAKTTDPSQGIFDVHTDEATVSTLPTFSISSILNQEIVGNVKGSDRVLNENALKDVDSSSMGFTGSPTAKVPVTNPVLNEKTASPSTNTGETETTNYLEASRVLGAVFNKVKDPLARKSVEVAIKAMLKLMKTESAYSKKETVPSVKNSWILQEKVKKLMKTIHQLSKVVDEEAKESSNQKRSHWRAKLKFFRRRIRGRHSSDHHKPHHTHHHHKPCNI